MKCNETRELMPDLAAGLTVVTPEVKAYPIPARSVQASSKRSRPDHVAAVDEWQAPEPSPYFDVRLRARLREESAKAIRWLAGMAA